MEETTQSNPRPMMPVQQLPNATATLVLGICSLVFGCFFIGLICGIVGLIISGKSVNLYRMNPMIYTGYSSLNAGRIMCIIGIVLAALSIIGYIVSILFVGAISMPYWQCWQ